MLYARAVNKLLLIMLPTEERVSIIGRVKPVSINTRETYKIRKKMRSIKILEKKNI